MPTPVVADAIAHYHDLLGRFDPRAWWLDHAQEVTRNWHTEAPMDAYILRPLLIDEATYASVQASVTQVARALVLAADRLATDEALRRALSIPTYMEPLLEADRANGKPPTLGRIDGIMGADGRLTLIEYNSEPQSAPFQYELERSFDRLPIAAEFAKTFRARTIDPYAQVQTALRERGRDGRMPCVAVIDKTLWRSHRRASIFRPLMHASARGCPVIYVDPEEVDYRNGQLSSGGIAIDLVAFPTWELMINARKRLVKILKAVSDGAVGVYAGLSRGLLASYKTVFELLSSPEHAAMFPPEVNEALARHIPWTRVLRERTTDHAGTTVDLLPFVADHRAELVIKPAGGGGGGNVFVGRDVTDEAWTAAIHKGVANNWIVQALAVPERQAFPVVSTTPGGTTGDIAFHDLNCEFTPYVYGGTRVEGVLCRVVSGSVIHDLGDKPIGVSNGVETATWIIDRR